MSSGNCRRAKELLNKKNQEADTAWFDAEVDFYSDPAKQLACQNIAIDNRILNKQETLLVACSTSTNSESRLGTHNRPGEN